MKRIISFCLAFTLIMSSLNFEVVEALSNKINEFTSVYSTLIQDESEEMNEMEVKESESEEISDFEGEKSESEEIVALEDKETGSEEKNNSEGNEVDLEETNISEEKEAELGDPTILKEGYSLRAITATVSTSGGSIENKGFPNLKEAFDFLSKKNSSNYEEMEIRFHEDYTITSNEAQYMKFAFESKNLIFSARNTDIVVTVDSGVDFELYHDKINHANGSNEKNIIFRNIKFKFLGNNNIYANGVKLYMGQNIVMEGSVYPRLFGGSKEGGSDIFAAIQMVIESGTYEDITTSSGNRGRNVFTNSYIYFYGGHAKNISTGKYNQKLSSYTMNVDLYGGTIDCIEEASKRTDDFGRINVNVCRDVKIKDIKNIRFIDIQEGRKLTISKGGYLNNNLNLRKNAILDMGKDATLDMNDLVISENSTIYLPANRGVADNAPLSIRNAYKANAFKLEVNTEITMEEFYLIKGKKGNLEYIKNNTIISEDKEFYVKVEEENKTNDYLIGRKKEKGPLIYNIGEEKFFYVNTNKKEVEAWWINNKIKNGSLKLFSELNYDDLAKANDNNQNYYVLSPSSITFKIKGTGVGKTLKFNNDRHNDREFNIEFENLSASNSEFSFININSIIVNGDNSITQDGNKPPLTYSLSPNSGNPISFTNDNSILALYRKDNDNNKYTIGSTINYNGAPLGDTSIINLSIEDTITSDRNVQLYSTNGGDTKNTKKFSIKNGYDEMSVLLKGDNKDYLLCNGDTTTPEGVYYYQTAKGNNNENSGPVGTKFTLIKNNSKNYYKVNNKQRVHVVANQGSQKFYYLEDTLKDSMDNDVNHANWTHEVIFLGDYEIKSTEDSTAIKNHSGSTNGITFKTKVDDWKYLLNVGEDVELKIDSNGNGYPVTFDQIKFNYTSADKWIYGNGRELTFGEDVVMEGSNYPSVSGGKSAGGNGTVQNTNVTIKSGTYKEVTGNRHNTVANANLTINGGTFNGEVNGISGGTGNTATLTIKNGTFASKVSGVKTGSTLNGALNMRIDGGTFDAVVVGVDGGTVDSNSTFTITNGTFNQKVYGMNSGSSLSGDLNLIIDNGTFKDRVSGASSNTTREKFNWNRVFKGKSSRSNTKITGNLNVTINNGNFTGQVNAASELDGGIVNLKIEGGTFNSNVGGISGDVNNVTLIMTIKGGEYRGQVFGQYSVKSTHNTTTLNIDGGTFNRQVYGMNDRGKISINVSGGTFNDGSRLTGNDHWRYNDTVINIKSDISIPVVDNFDKLVVGEDKKVILTITDKIYEREYLFASELLMKNGSEVKLQGNNQSSVDKLTIEDSGNSLTLAMNNYNAPLVVKGAYNAGGQKLTLKALKEKSDNNKLIEFSGIKADANNFNFIDAEYYIREIDDSNGAGNTIKIYEKMDPQDLTFKFDGNGSKIQYSLGNGIFSDVWWYNPNETNKSNKDITFSKDDMFKYKGMNLFKDMNNIASRTKVFEMNNSSLDSKNVYIDLGAGTNFDLKLSNSNLTNSTVDAKNLGNIIIDGNNSISTEVSETKPALSYQISGEVQATNGSNLVVYTGKDNQSFSGYKVTGGSAKLAKVIDFKFREDLKVGDVVRLATTGVNDLTLTMPRDTGRLGVLLGSSNNSTYNLYHGASSKTGTSVYVSGNTEKTFRESFDTVAQDSGTIYDYVRRANPISTVSADITNNIDFTIDTKAVGLHGINPDNWEQYFKATDTNVKNTSLVCKDVFTDDQGNTHYFGKENVDLEFGYLGVQSVTNSTNSIELVQKDVLDSNITNTTGNVKLALKFGDEKNDIPLNEKAGITTTPLGRWNVSSNSNKNLKIVPDFNNDKIFYNVSNSSAEEIKSSHNFIYRLELKMTP